VNLSLRVCGETVIICDGTAEVYRLEPDGESCQPGQAPDGRSWHELGQEEILAAATIPGLVITYWPHRTEILRAAAVIRELRKDPS
jgi:hypothetical protein